MRTSVLALAVTLGVAHAARAQDAKAKGEQVYAAQKCAVCHSVGAVGNRKGPLDNVGGKLTPEEIRLWIVDATGMAAKTKALRKPAMRNYALPPEELDALVAYLASLKT